MFNYSSFLATLNFNYIVYKTKTDQNFAELLNKIFRDKAKIKHEFFLEKYQDQNLKDMPTIDFTQLDMII